MSILFLLSSCSLYNSFYTASYNISTSVTNQPYQAKYQRFYTEHDTTFPGNGTGIVSMRIKVVGSDLGIDSFWRRVEYSSYSSRLNLTRKNSQRVELMLPPGIYFLDGFRFVFGGTTWKKGLFNQLYSDQQSGWDFLNQKPRWFSFDVKAGEKISLPDIFIFAYCKNGKRKCSDEETLTVIKIDDTTNSHETKKYKVGYEIIEK